MTEQQWTTTPPTQDAVIQKALEKIASIAEKLLREAFPLQEQFNPESYEVSAETIIKLTEALHELESADAP